MSCVFRAKRILLTQLWFRLVDADVYAILVQILSTLQRSPVFPREAADKKTRFWNVHKTQSEEYDQEFYEKYSGSMDNSTIFVRRTPTPF